MPDDAGYRPPAATGRDAPVTAAPEPGFRRLLMLQGPVGPFFRRLARCLRRRGVDVHKVNMNGGDVAFFPGPGAHSWRGRPKDWPDYVGGLMDRLDVDAVALFGDCRPLHRAAIAVAAERNIPVFVFEEGYLRPDHVTVELGGVNGFSALMGMGTIPPAAFGAAPVRVGNSFPSLAFWAVLYLMANDAGRILFPFYRHHRGHCLEEGLAHLRWAVRRWTGAARDRRLVKDATSAGKRYFLLPLQVYFDSQITMHSPFRSVEQLVAFVIRSFAAHAPADTALLIKHHPLDRGHRDYGGVIADVAKEANCADRLVYFTEGHLPTLLDGAAGVVTCNSTVGLQSLRHGTPAKVLGKAVYDRPGLTSQGPLDDFWAAPGMVDMAKLSAFSAYLQAACLANGSFYAAHARTGLLDQVVDRMVRQYEAAPGQPETAGSRDHRQGTASRRDAPLGALAPLARGGDVLGAE